MQSQRKRSRNRARGLAALAALALAAMALGAPAALAADAHYEGISEDGGVAVFSTTDKLVAGDTDVQRDVYVRDFEEGLGYVTREASLGPTGGNDAFAAQFLAIDPAGDKVFFSTRERLTADDKDNSTDIYVRDLESNTTTLVSAGVRVLCGLGLRQRRNRRRCGRGRRGRRRQQDLLHQQREAGVPGRRRKRRRLRPRPRSRHDDAGLRRGLAVLRRAAARAPSRPSSRALRRTARRRSSPPPSRWSAPIRTAKPTSTSATSRRAKRSSSRPPAPAPKHARRDTTANRSTARISADGAHVFFETNERISAGDSDDSQDVYDWSGGDREPGLDRSERRRTANATRSSKAAPPTGRRSSSPPANRSSPPTPTRSRTSTSAAAASTELVSAGDPSCSGSNCGNGEPRPAPVGLRRRLGRRPQHRGTADGRGRRRQSRRLLARAARRADDARLPARPDLHRPGLRRRQLQRQLLRRLRRRLPPLLRHRGSAGAAGRRRPTGPGDRDERTDVYERSGGVTTWSRRGSSTAAASTAATARSTPSSRARRRRRHRAFLTTNEQLAPKPTHDSGEDVYKRSGERHAAGLTGQRPRTGSRTGCRRRRCSRAPIPESPGASTEPKVLGTEPVEGASIKLYTTSDCSGEPVATGTAAELEEPGIAVKVAPGTATTLPRDRRSGRLRLALLGRSRLQAAEPKPPLEEGGGGGGGRWPRRPRRRTGVADSRRPLVPIPHEVPQTRITFGPAFKTRIRRPIFRFADATGQQGTTFICKVDREAWKSCSSPRQADEAEPRQAHLPGQGGQRGRRREPKPSKREFKLVASMRRLREPPCRPRPRGRPDPGRAAGRLCDERDPRRRRMHDADQRRPRPADGEQEGRRKSPRRATCSSG